MDFTLWTHTPAEWLNKKHWIYELMMWMIYLACTRVLSAKKTVYNVSKKIVFNVNVEMCLVIVAVSESPLTNTHSHCKTHWHWLKFDKISQ